MRKNPTTKAILLKAVFVGLFCLFLSVPSAQAYYTNMSASVVIGQSDFTSGSSATSQTALNFPGSSMAVVNGKMIVPDTNNNRVLIWNSIPTSNAAAADLVLGQTSFTDNSCNQGAGTAAANTLCAPSGVSSDGTRLFVADFNNNRVLIFNHIPTTNNASADVVIGQTNFTNRSQNQGGSANSNTLKQPQFAFAVNGKLIISEQGNNRVLIFNQIPTTNNVSADVVIGQQNFTSGSANQGGTVNANTLNAPIGMASDGTKLLITDSSNHRVLIFNQIPTTNNVSADVVIGQGDFTHNSANQGGSASGSSLNVPAGISFDDKRLYISDYSNNRLLIFNQIPTTNNVSADVVIGQPDMVTTTSGTTSNKITNPHGAYAASNLNKLFLIDRLNHRILIFTNTTSDPRLGISSIEGRDEGKLRLNGNVQVNGGQYDLWKMEASVNGGDYTGVSSFTRGVLYPGTSQNVAGTFYHDFEPWANNNGSKDDWLKDSAKEHQERGYTIKLKAFNNNTDTGQPLFYFTPFTLTSPAATASSSAVISRSPTFAFSVNKYQRTEFKDNLDHYEAFIKKDGGSWEKYISSIPVDFDLVKNNADNLRRNDYVANPGSGNGTYENNDLIVTFANSSSTISVRKKGTQEGTVDLTPGSYQVRVTSVDKHGHTQDTQAVSVTVKGSPNNKKNLAITGEWFPLQINRISGSRLGILSSFNPVTESSGFLSTSVPLIDGIAFSGTRITLTVTDTNSGATRTYTTTASNSAWSMTPTLYPTSLIDVSAESVDGKYTELATITLTVASQ